MQFFDEIAERARWIDGQVLEIQKCRSSGRSRRPIEVPQAQSMTFDPELQQTVALPQAHHSLQNAVDDVPLEGGCDSERTQRTVGGPTGAVHRQDRERPCEDETTSACDSTVQATVALPQVQHVEEIVNDIMS